jgi:hypothetical protein
VEKDRFKGTCYKAANWIWVGQTKGIAKRGHDHLFHGNIKDVYLYPLKKDFREKLARLPSQGTSGQREYPGRSSSFRPDHEVFGEPIPKIHHQQC